MSLSVKYRAIYRYRDKYSITAMCKSFAVSRSGYYDFRKRINKPDKDALGPNDKRVPGTVQVKHTAIDGLKYGCIERSNYWLTIKPYCES